MKRHTKRQTTAFLMLLVLFAALIGSLSDYATQNKRAVRDGIYQTLDEAARQQLMLFTEKLNDQFAQLTILADFISEQNLELSDETLRAMNQTAEEYKLYGVGLIDAKSGTAHLNSGISFDASGRAYYTRALAGERVIEYSEHGRLTNIPIVVLAVPVYQGGAAKAVLFACYKADGFANLLETTAFSGQSYSYITDSDGCIVVEPNHESALLSGNNVLDFLSGVELERGVTVEQIAGRMEDGSALTFSFATGGKSRYVTVMPVGINDWSLFYVATDTVVTERTNASATMVYTLAVKMLLLFAAFIVALFVHERNSQRAIALREEEFRIAAGQSDKIIARYDIQQKTATYAVGNTPEGACKRALTEGVPESAVEAGLIAPESVDNYLAFYAAMQRGEPNGTTVCRMRVNNEDFSWFRADYTLAGSGKHPRYAIISLGDVTQQREREIVYEKWQQSLRDRAPDSYSLYHCSVSGNAVLDATEGLLLPVEHSTKDARLDERTAGYADTCVYSEDRERFLSVMDRNVQLLRFRQGRKTDTLEYRETLPGGTVRWLRLTVDLLSAPYSNEIEAYYLFENIDEAKRTELAILERAQTDPLTGLLNRTTFLQKVDKRILESKPGAKHALLMLDIDGFKLVNDAFGHAAGDQALLDIAEQLSRGSRKNDLVGRLGGDEFVVFLSDVVSDSAAERRAQQICALTRKSFSPDVQISSSVGIALYPRDGDSFDVLYKKADDSLYYVKGAGKDSYAFYRGGMAAAQTPRQQVEQKAVARPPSGRKRRMLIVDDSEADTLLLRNLFKEDFTIETATDGDAALSKLRHYGSAISIVLLDLLMPGTDGFSVLERMRGQEDARSIPVIVVSGTADQDAGLRAVHAGATDFATKPIDPDVLRIRVQSALSKAENERLRARSSYLELQNSEMRCYRAALEHSGMLLLSCDRAGDAFAYSPAVSKALAGTYDSRSLWDVLLSDGVADAETVRRMQAFVRDAADNRAEAHAVLSLQLRSAAGEMRPYRMDVCCETGGEHTEKLILMLREIQEGNAQCETK